MRVGRLTGLRAAIGVLALCLAAISARAEEESVTASLTQDVIHITSSFSGAEIVMYGAIESQDAFIGADERDIVVVVRGAEVQATVRKRERMAGLWLNADEAVFSRVPSFYYLASTAPLERIAAPAVLERNNLGLDNLPLVGPKRPDAEDFEKALIRNKMADALFVQDIGGVTMNGPALFQARIKLPASIPIGQYTAEAYLFRNGQSIGAYSATLEVDKTGLERTLFNFANRHAALYGIFAIVIAITMGLGAAFVFRERD
jgi:uncharacterized protein (TIGR02186 family)